MLLSATHLEKIERVVQAIAERENYAPFPEHPKAYDNALFIAGRTAYEKLENNHYGALLPHGAATFIGQEVSPYSREALGVSYPRQASADLIKNAEVAFQSLQNIKWETRASILMQAMERIEKRFFEIAMAGLHTTGQAFVMSFQSNGPHALGSSLEVIASGFKVFRSKDREPAPKGIALVIANATFPVLYSVPAIFANLLCGNTVLVKPHPSAILPLAIYVEEIQQAFQEAGQNPLSIQLAVDSPDAPIAKDLAEHKAIKLIDYTGKKAFGDYLESLQNKTVFTQKSVVNSVIVHSSKDLRESMRNLAFRASLYSGQRCTGPQNVFIPATGVYDGKELIDFETAVDLLQNEVASLAYNPQMAAGILGAIQSQETIDKIDKLSSKNHKLILAPPKVKNPEFAGARMRAIKILQLDSANYTDYSDEHYGPVLFVVKTKDINEAIALSKKIALEKGSKTCSVYTTNEGISADIIDAMKSGFTPVSFNLSGFALVNNQSPFSSTSGNPNGSAGITSQFINKRFV